MDVCMMLYAGINEESLTDKMNNLGRWRQSDECI